MRSPRKNIELLIEFELSLVDLEVAWQKGLPTSLKAHRRHANRSWRNRTFNQLGVHPSHVILTWNDYYTAKKNLKVRINQIRQVLWLSPHTPIPTL